MEVVPWHGILKEKYKFFQTCAVVSILLHPFVAIRTIGFVVSILHNVSPNCLQWAYHRKN